MCSVFCTCLGLVTNPSQWRAKDYRRFKVPLTATTHNNYRFFVDSHRFGVQSTKGRNFQGPLFYTWRKKLFMDFLSQRVNALPGHGLRKKGRVPRQHRLWVFGWQHLQIPVSKTTATIRTTVSKPPHCQRPGTTFIVLLVHLSRS